MMITHTRPENRPKPRRPGATQPAEASPGRRGRRLRLLLVFGFLICGGSAWWATRERVPSLNELRQMPLVEVEKQAYSGAGRVPASCVLGERYLMDGREEEAAAAFQKARVLEPLSAAALAGFVLARAAQARPGWAEVVLRELCRAQPYRFEPQLALGWLYYQNGELDAAGPPLREALRLAPEDGEAQFHHGVWSGTIGNTGGGIESLERACRLAPKIGRYHVAAADLLIHLGRYPEARKHLRLAEELQPGTALVHYHTGRLLLAGKPTEADKREGIRRLEQALTAAPEWDLPRLTLGRQCIEGGDPKRGIQEMERVAAMKPPTGQILAVLAQGYYRIGKRDEGDRLIRRYNATLVKQRAEQALKDEIRTQPRSVAPRLRRARALRARGLDLQALTFYREIAALEPANAEAARAIRDLTLAPQ